MEGVQNLESIANTGSCPICGDGIVGSHSCGDCGVQCCGECREFVGTCPTFGCGAQPDGHRFSFTSELNTAEDLIQLGEVVESGVEICPELLSSYRLEPAHQGLVEEFMNLYSESKKRPSGLMAAAQVVSGFTLPIVGAYVLVRAGFDIGTGYLLTSTLLGSLTVCNALENKSFDSAIRYATLIRQANE